MSLRRYRAVVACILLVFVLGVIGFYSSRAEAPRASVWNIVSTATLDSRIQRQLQELATENHAVVQFSSHETSPQRTQPETRELEFVLQEAASVESLCAELKREASASPVEPTVDLAREGYILRVSYDGDSVLDGIHIKAASATGFHNALLRLATLLGAAPANVAGALFPRAQSVRVERNGREVLIADYSSFPIRGVVEGFYGRPWSHQDRLDVLRFEGQHSMNIYFYGPKDDPFHRSRWREPYPPEDLDRLRELADAAKEQFVDFSFAISPGLSMTYSDEKEFSILANKLLAVSKLGVTNFALFLDDVPQDLLHPRDKARFKTLAEAHVFIINKLYAYLTSLSPQNRLSVCPTTYTNEWGNRDYVREIGAGVDPHIPIDWTGTFVGSREITTQQAQEWGSYLHRKPLVWDNFPGNDGRPWLLILEPVSGRESTLPSAILGLFSNPMYQAHASFLPLQTVADYLWNPQAYDGQASLTHAMVSQFGSDGPERLAPLLRIYGGDSEDKLAFGRIFDEHHSPIDIPAIRSQIASLSRAISTLSGQKEFEKLTDEIAPIRDMVRVQLQRVLDDPAFRHLPDGKIQWDEEYDKLRAFRLSAKPNLDGDFSKWQSGPVYALDASAQIEDGADLWTGPAQFSARVALAWDVNNLYIGVDVTDKQLWQPFLGRGIQDGDAFRVVLDTAPPGEPRVGRATGAYDLYFSPGNFADVKPSVYCEEDFIPPRPSLRRHDYGREIGTAWRKTPTGFSGDIVIPKSFFANRDFSPGQKIGFSFGAQKSFPSSSAFDEDLPQISFWSKKDSLFHVNPENPVTFQRLVLVDFQGRQ